MKIKFVLLSVALLLFGFATFAQTSKDISLRLSNDKTTIRYIAVFYGNVVFNVNAKGAIKLSRLRPGKRVFDDAFGNSGKPRSVDNLSIVYYDDFNEYTAGKLKSVGPVNISYIDQFDSFDNRGKVKAIGKTTFAYTDRFDGFDNRGKLKSIGDMKITYYDRFDGSDLNGKIKSIGNTVIKYYDSFDWSGKKGTIKSIEGETPNVYIDNLVDDEADGF